MNRKYPVTLLILLTIIISACGKSAEPTMAADDIANTAKADAWISITQTEAALPSPTSTTEPTLTPFPTLPPLPTISNETPVSVATVDECNQIPPLEPKGVLVNVEFRNDAQGPANLAFGMNSANNQGECVTYSYSIGMGNVVTAKVLMGCYWGYAWITAKELSNAKGGGLCLTDPNLTYHIIVGKESIHLK